MNKQQIWGNNYNEDGKVFLVSVLHCCQTAQKKNSNTHE